MVLVDKSNIGMTGSVTRVQIHMTNVSGLGATKLVTSLVPALARCGDLSPVTAFVGADGGLADMCARSGIRHVQVMRRVLPNSASRLVECLKPRLRGINRQIPLLVLGDLPLACHPGQIVLLHNPHIFSSEGTSVGFGRVRSVVSQWIFLRNLANAARIVVQTSAMERALEVSGKLDMARVVRIANAPPEWARYVPERRAQIGRVDPRRGIKLVYPAAGYPHKNHCLLSRLDSAIHENSIVREIVLTIEQDANPCPHLPWVSCVGLLSQEQMVEMYSGADALLFLSRSESLGLPLIEAIAIGLPIVCPDLPYARAVCGDGAIYFDVDDPESLGRAIVDLQLRLVSGWIPDWSRQRAMIPGSWDDVAKEFAKVINASWAAAQ